MKKNPLKSDKKKGYKYEFKKLSVHLNGKKNYRKEFESRKKDRIIQLELLNNMSPYVTTHVTVV